MRLITTIVFGLMISTVSGQDVQAEIRKMNLVYVKSSSYQMDLTVDAIDASNKIFSSEKARVAVAKGNYFSTYNGVTTILNNDHFVSVDDNNKTIVINPVGKKQSSGNTDLEAIIDSLMLLDNTEINVITNSANKLHFSIKMTDPYYSRMTVTIDPRTHHLTQVVYYLNTSLDYPYSHIRINYSNIKIDTRISKNEFSTSRYLIIHGNSIKPTQAYSGYKIINNTHAKK